MADFGVSFVGDWVKAAQTFERLGKDFTGAMNRVTRQEAEFWRGKLVLGLTSQSPGGKRLAPLSPATLRWRRGRGFKGSKALIVRGDLRNAIRVHFNEGTGTAFVGILRNARGQDGQRLANVGAMNEFGFVSVRTVRQRIGRGQVVTKAVVTRIPPRPFIRPVFEQFGKPAQVRARVLERLKKELKL